jgi:hypothetical protein
LSHQIQEQDGTGENTAHITDWITLVMSLLQWHAWLKQDTIPKVLVNKSKMAMKWLMRHFKFIALHPTGMKNNNIKFHLILHLADDILDHGVPQNFNSSFAKTAHISLAKDTARNMQKRTALFVYKAAQRYVEKLSSTFRHGFFCSIATAPKSRSVSCAFQRTDGNAVKPRYLCPVTAWGRMWAAN